MKPNFGTRTAKVLTSITTILLSACGGGGSSAPSPSAEGVYGGALSGSASSSFEPAIGHLKSDHRLDRCWLKGALGDALHAISCAAGYNLRWLLRAIARLGIGPAFFRLLQMALRVARPMIGSLGGTSHDASALPTTRGSVAHWPRHGELRRAFA